MAVAWKGTFEDTAARAAELMPSGAVRWGLDSEQEIFALFKVPYQPHTILITADKEIFASWPGAMSEEDLRRQIEALLANS